MVFPPQERVDCLQMYQDSCESAGCCWGPVERPSGANPPWCFYKDRDSAFPSKPWPFWGIPHSQKKKHMAFCFWIVMCIYYIRNYIYLKIYIYSNISYVAVATIVIKYKWGYITTPPRSDPPNDKWLRFTLWGWLAGSSWLEEHPPSNLGLFKMENSPPWPFSIIKYL